MPAANPSIQALYAAVSAAPPAEYCAQSRKGRLYATSTGMRPCAAAAVTTSSTAASTSAGVPEVNQSADGIEPSSWASSRACPVSDWAASRVVLHGLT